MADLYELPSADDAGLVCTNVRSMDGKRPVFIDAIGSTFFFPYHIVRFLEIPEAEMAAHRASGGGCRAEPARWSRRSPTAATPRTTDGPPADDAAHADGQTVAPAGRRRRPGARPGRDDDLELEIDEGFLQRIRDI